MKCLCIIWAKPANVDTIYRMVNHIFEPWYIIQMKSSAANYSFRVNASLGHAGAVKEDIKYVLPLKNGLLDSNPIVIKLKLKSG